jgi:hypothetical protein
MPDRPHASEIQQKLCGLAERIASEQFGTRLDFSVESVREVERILGELHKDYKCTRSEDGLHGIALEFGAYIVSVIQRHFGPAQWERDCASLGQDAFPLHWRGTSIYPYAWCMKRIYDGPGDDVWLKFHAIVLEDECKRGVGNETR